MKKNTEPPKTSAEELAKFYVEGRELIFAQTREVDALIDDLRTLDDKQARLCISVPLFMLQAVGVSAHSVLALTHKRDMGIRDCFGIARSAVETAINAAFIAVSGEPMAEKAVRHMRQKRWRDLNRQGNVGKLRIEVSRDIGIEADEIPGLNEAIAEYTNKKGDEIRDWTSENLEKRISAISARNERAGMCLGVAFFSIYRPASELLHGTFYGVNFFWQGSRTTPAHSQAEFDELWVTEHFVTLVTALFCGISGAIEAIAGVHALETYAKRQANLTRVLSEVVEGIGTNSEDREHRFEIKK